jgi:serine/threonine-protein kinase
MAGDEAMNAAIAALAWFAKLLERIVRRLSRPAASSTPGVRELGSYRLLRLLGKGGMGEVWQAEHDRLARPAAIKLVNVESLESGDEHDRKKLLQRFEYEARATASLHSPHTVTVYDFGVSEAGTFYYVMEMLSGLDLQTLVEKFGPLPPARVVHILTQVLDSLAEAHAQSMVHRDVKPANIYLTRLGLEHDFAKVLDFGLVSHAKGCYRAGESHLTAENTIVGTPEYMAPEMAEGGPVDPRADLYALGAVAYWLLTGTEVFAAGRRTPMQVIADHMRTEPQPPSERLGEALPAELEEIVMQLLAKDPDDRPASALELRARLLSLELDDAWSAEHARVWWTRNLPELVAPSRHSTTTTIRQLAPAA